MTIRLLFTALLVTLVGCADKEAPEPAPATDPAPAVRQESASAPSFVNKVWSVAESPRAERGALRTFLSDGTLVLSSRDATPAFGAWRYSDGRLTIIEHGEEYVAEIVELTDERLRLRLLGRDEPVEMRFTLADAVPPDAATAADSERAAATAPDPVALWGTAWRLQSLAGADVPDRTRATLEFPIEGRASGNGGCNRYHGVVTVEGHRIRFGGIAATRMACAAAALRQEDAYFAALRDAERFGIADDRLQIHVAGREEPLTFVAMQPTAAAPRTGIERSSGAPATASSLAGIWTITGHIAPGPGAVSDEEARARYGRTIRLTPRAAVSGGERCREPRYASSRHPAASWLAGEYRLRPADLPPLSLRGQVQVLEVSCGASSWNAPGARLIEIDRDRALAPWDGIFFELERDRDFRAVGQEPGWQLELRTGSEMRFIHDYGRRTAVTPAPPARVDADTGTRTLRATSGDGELGVVIVPVACNDSMSGRAYPATVTVTHDGRTFRGCGEPLATPYEG